jgi:hypothetical protein
MARTLDVDQWTISRELKRKKGDVAIVINRPNSARSVAARAPPRLARMTPHVISSVRLAKPDKHLEIMASGPLLLTSVGQLSQTSRQKTMTITHTHGRDRPAQETYRRS